MWRGWDSGSMSKNHTAMSKSHTAELPQRRPGGLIPLRTLLVGTTVVRRRPSPEGCCRPVPDQVLPAEAPAPTPEGAVVGHVHGARAGMEALAAGGNAVDAIVTAALTAAVTELSMCGIGGYGGHMVIAPASGPAVAIDYN